MALKLVFYPRGASDARVLAVVVCLSVCHTPVLHQFCLK